MTAIPPGRFAIQNKVRNDNRSGTTRHGSWQTRANRAAYFTLELGRLDLSLERAWHQRSDPNMRTRCASSLDYKRVWRMAVTVYGVCALTFMMSMYALEGRHVGFVAAFAVGCVASSAYGFLAGTWPFGAVELLWSVIALRRYLDTRQQNDAR